MKRLSKLLELLTLLICVLAVFLSSFPSALAAAEQVSGEVLTVGVPTDRCPVFYQDARTGEIVGIGVDLMRAAAEEAGFTVAFQSIGKQSLKEALDHEEYDLVMPFGSAIESASGHSTLVSGNLFQTPFTIVTISGKNQPPLNELRVGMLHSLSGVVETMHQLYPGIEIVPYESMSQCVNALRAGKVDALLHNSYVWNYVLQKPSYSDLAVHPSAMFAMDFRAGTLDTPAGQELLERLNGGIAKLTDTRRQAIILDYTSRRLYRYDFFDYLYQYGQLLLLGGLLFAALVVIAVQKLRELRHEQEKRVQRMVDYDPLTGALSMNGFRKRVEELLRVHPDIPYYISYNNILNFKFINDSLGMDAGDELLRFWTAKSQEVLSEEEAIGRIEGDHIVILRSVAGDERMLEDGEHVLNPVRNYFIDRGKEKRIQICSGIYVLTPEDYRHIDVDHMLDFARVAEKKVRDSHQGGFAFYNPDQWDRGKRMSDIVGRLPLAIQSGELQVWYQPQVEYQTGQITGLEALCRWNHPKLGWISPAVFIPALEEAGLIYELDCFVWDRVCQDLQRWKGQGYHRFVSLNLSRNDIREDRDLPGHFYNLIQTYGLTADQLRIEITETAYAKEPGLLIDTTEKLREFGFQVEMDDFGSGFSSLHMLKEVPVDRIKLDLHFLSGTGDPERGRIIVSYMIQMVHALGMNLIAEGVENITQARFLQSRGCSEMQGFYFFKPMSLQDFENLIERTGLSF